MRSLIPVIFILLLLWLLGGAWYLSNNHCLGSSIPNLSVYDNGSKALASTSAVYYFDSQSDKLHTNDENKIFFKNIATYLKKNEDRMLTLTGQFGSTESNSKIDNLGRARANAIKKLLVKHKVNESQIVVKDKKVDQTYFIGKKLYGGVDYKFSSNNSDSSSSSDSGSDSSSSTTSVSSGNGKYMLGKNTDIVMTDDLRAFLDGAVAKVASNPGSFIRCEGFAADKSGLREAKSMATQVRRLLRDIGKVSSAAVPTGKIVSNIDPDKAGSVEIFVDK